MTEHPDGSFAALTAAIAADPETSAQVYGDMAQPDLPYTDDDLRAEAASCLHALSIPPTVADVRRSLPETYIDSHRTDDGGYTWGDVVGEAGLGTASGEIHALIEGAADVSEWAVNLGADGLQPDGHTLQLGASDGADDGDQPRVRLHFAFDPDMQPDDRDRFVMELSKVVLRNLGNL